MDEIWPVIVFGTLTAVSSSSSEILALYVWVWVSAAANHIFASFHRQIVIQFLLHVDEIMVADDHTGNASDEDVEMMQPEANTASTMATRLQDAEVSHRERNLRIMNQHRSPEERRARWSGCEEARQRDRQAQVVAQLQGSDNYVNVTTHNGVNNSDVAKNTEQTFANHHVAQDAANLASINKGRAARDVTPTAAAEQDKFVNIDLGKPLPSSVEPDDAKEWVVVPDV